VMSERLQTASRSVARTAGPEEPFRSLAPDPLERVALDALLAAAEHAHQPARQRIVDHEVAHRQQGPSYARSLAIWLPAMYPWTSALPSPCWLPPPLASPPL